MNRFMLMALVAIVSLVEVAAGQGFGGSTENPGGWGSRASSSGAFSRLFQEPAAAEKALQELKERFATLDKQIEQPLSERDLSVKEMPSQKVPLSRADPKLLENKFRAALEFTIGKGDPKTPLAAAEFDVVDDSAASVWIWGNPPSDAQRQLVMATFQLGGPLRIGTLRGNRFEFGLWSKYFQVLTELCPPDQRPEASVLDFLTSADADRDVTSAGFREFSFDDQYRLSLVFTVDAPTSDEAEARARGIARLLDGGMSRPVQTYMLARGKEKLTDAEARLAEIAKLSEAIAAEEKFLATPSEISPEILTQLKSQKVMIAVEEAGLSARVKACDAMLADNRKLEISTLQSIGDMKVKAEIERVGLKEKLDQINKFIGEGDERNRRQGQIQTLAAKLRVEQSRFGTAMSYATHFANLVDLFAPLEVTDNEIALSPIEWTAPRQE